MVKNISKALKCSIRQVKICLAVLKGDDKDIHVSKGMLEEAVKQKMEEEDPMKKIKNLKRIERG